MEEKNGKSCPLCKTKWEDIPIPNLRRFIAALIVIVALCGLQLWKKVVDKTLPTNDYEYAISIIFILVFLSALFVAIYEASVYLKREPWCIFFDEKSRVHLHSKDPRESSEWIKWSKKNNLGVADPIIRFMVDSPESCYVVSTDGEIRAWKRITYTRERYILIEDEYGGVIAGKGLGVEEPAYEVLQYIKRFRTPTDMRMKFNQMSRKLGQLKLLTRSIEGAQNGDGYIPTRRRGRRT